MKDKQLLASFLSAKSARTKACRRNDIQQFIDRFSARSKSDMLPLKSVIRTLEGLLEGYDMRPALGVKPKRGAPPKFEGPYHLLAIEYYALCELHPEKVAASVVAEHWQMSLPNVRRLAKARRSAFEEKRAELARRPGGFKAAAAEARYIGAVIAGRATKELRLECVSAGAEGVLTGDKRALARRRGLN